MRAKWMQRIPTPDIAFQAFEGTVIEAPDVEPCSDDFVPFLGDHCRWSC